MVNTVIYWSFYNPYYIDVEQYLRERTHGGCNILHLLSSLSSPVPPTPTAINNSGRGRPTQPTGLREIMHQALQLASTSGLLHPFLHCY